MRLRKLLLGSAAAMFVVGASTGAAKAADPVNGLVVTMAEYLESCSGGNGIQFSTWCFYFNGSSTFTSKVGYVIDFGTTPGTATVEDVNGAPAGTAFPWTGFDLSNKLALTATRDWGDDKTITIKVPIVGTGTTSLAISRAGGATWTFTSSSVSVFLPTSLADFTFVVAEGGAHPFWPDLDATAAFTFGDFTVTAHGGVGFDDADLNGGAVAIYFEPEADLKVAGAFGAVSFDVTGYFRRVQNAGLVNAFGVVGNVSATFGAVTANAGVGYGVENDFSGHYNYDIGVGDRILAAWGGLSFAMNDYNTTKLNVIYATSLVYVNSTTVEVTLGHTYSMDGLSVGGELWYTRAYDGGGAPLAAFGAGLTLGVTLN